MASVSLVSSPPAPVLDKNMTDSELAGDERSSNNLMQFLIRSSVRFSAVGLLVLLFSFFFLFFLFFEIMNCRAETFPGFSPSTYICMPFGAME